MFSEDSADIVVGCTSGKKVHLGQLDQVTIQDGNLTTSGNISTKGQWVSVNGGEISFGSDATNAMLIKTTNPKITMLIITNYGANSPVDVVCRDVRCRSVIQSSDARLKDKIEPITGALARVVRLCGVSFDWKADNRVEGAPKHLGLIAQQVREVVPEAVVDANEGSLSITYNAITALLVEAIKEQQQHIDELRAALTPAPVH